MKLTLSNAALADFEELLAYGHAQFGREVAENYGEALISRLEILNENPKAGRALDRQPAGPRFLTYRSHVILYQLEGERITILRILDARRNWQSLRFD